MRQSLEIKGTDLEVVAYVNAGGNLIIRVNKAGVCVQDVTVANATAERNADTLMRIGALTRPVIRDLDKATLNDLLREHRDEGEAHSTAVLGKH